MENFIIRFFICNIFISAMIGILLAAKWLLKKHLSSRLQYHLWFFLFALLTIPFLPIRPIGFPQIFSWLEKLITASASNPAASTAMTSAPNQSDAVNWMQDFSLSVSRNAPSVTSLIFGIIWLSGIVAMIGFMIKSKARLKTVTRSALPLQNRKVRHLYKQCLNEMHIAKDIPLYSTAFLKSPVIAGLWNPRIYLPIHLISDLNAADIRYILLHELQHYKHKDNLANYLISFAAVLYWFNPFVWYALQEMRNDREIACDTSVLQMLPESEYEDYGTTLINFAEKVSMNVFPFAAGISGNKKQIKQRIINIASYEKPSVWKKLKGGIAFGIAAFLLSGFAPVLSTYAAAENQYHWNHTAKNISYVDFSSYFDGYEGSFVLYDSENESWSIYDIEHATMRISPDSTYKIYDALLGLEAGVITPENSLLVWDKKVYPFDEWNANQNLHSAMQSSVNWYFQTIDTTLGLPAIKDFVQKIGYGNESINNNLSAYWIENSLKISPVEQVELLQKLYENSFDFAPENIQAVKDSIRLTSSSGGTLYGKTGTGRVDNQDVNGWFIGYVESSERTCFFAANIQAAESATGSTASNITLSILSDLQIWQ